MASAAAGRVREGNSYAYPVAGKPSEAKTGQNRFRSPAPISPEGFAR